MGYTPPAEVVTELIEFQHDNHIAQGCLFKPDPNRFAACGTGLVLVHGVESYWYSSPTLFLAGNLAAAGYTALGYNGVHSGDSFRSSTFEDAVAEVQEAVRFMKRRGFDKIVLLGHSLGTPIVEYYQGDRPDPAVNAVAVYGPHIDIPAVTRDSLLGAEMYERFAAECRELVAQGQGEEIKLLPFREGRVIITSAKTFISYRDVKTSKAAVATMIPQIKVPLLIVYDSADNIQGKGSVTMRASIAERIKASAVNAPSVDIRVIPSQPGNSPFQAHQFINNESIVTQATLNWLNACGLDPAPTR